MRRYRVVGMDCRKDTAEIENGSPRKASVSTPPTAASGTLRKIRSAGLTALKVP